MTKILEDMTIEKLREAAQRGDIQADQRFLVVLDDGKTERPKLADIAARMRETAIARGLTNEIFDSLLARP